MYPGGAWLKDSTIQPNSVGLFGSKNIHPDLLLSWMIKKTLYITLSLCPSGCLENTQTIHPVSHVGPGPFHLWPTGQQLSKQGSRMIALQLPG
jgi:hypothetical protein